MRLTDDILRASDNCTLEIIGEALTLAAAGRFGLLPSSKPFDVSLNISKGIVDVVQLNCLAVTKNGDLIDVNYDTKYTNIFDTSIQIPETNGENELLLTINAQIEQWRDTIDGFEEPVFSFSLIRTDCPVPANSFPIARIVDDIGWRMDDILFVPPCLFVSSHSKYLDLLHQFSKLLYEIDTKARGLVHSNAKEAIRVFWPIVEQLMITVDKECDIMTPMGLLANVQKCVSAFTCACEIDEYLNLADADLFKSYVYTPYNYKDCYLKIKEGLDICFSIREKIGKIEEMPKPQVVTPKQTVVPAPNVAKEELYQECTTPETTINIIYNILEANIFFTTDGKNPSTMSFKASKTKNGFKIKFDNEFRKEKGKEPDKTITLKLIAVVNGANSEISCFNVNLHKSLKFTPAIPI